MKLTLGNNKEIEFILSFDDGFKQDLKIAELLRRYCLPGIFYIPSVKRELTDSEVKDISEDFEIGNHTKNHYILRPAAKDIAYCEIKEGREDMEQLIGKPVTSFCYPRGRYDAEIKQMVKDAGMTDARTTKVLDIYRNPDSYELGTTVHCYDRTEYRGKPWQNIALELFDEVIDQDNTANYYHLWGHGWEIDRFDYWADFEWLLSYFKEKIYVKDL